MKSVILLQLFLLILCEWFPFAQAQPQFEAMKSEAQREMQAGLYGEAIDLLDRYISAHPQQPDGYNLRGLCNEKRKQFEFAVYDYRSALKLAPTDKEINQNLERSTKLWYSLLYNEIEGYKREIAINPDKPENYLEIGKAYKNLGQWSVAEEWYDRYLSRAHASPDEIIRYSEILAKNNHIAKGWPILKRYTEEYPNDQRIWSRFGYFSLWLGKNKIAIEAFQNSLAIKPFFREAQSGLDEATGKGYIYTVNDTSTKHFNYGLPPVRPVFVYPIDRYYRILKHNPDDNKIRLTLIKALYKVDRFEEASPTAKNLKEKSWGAMKKYLFFFFLIITSANALAQVNSTEIDSSEIARLSAKIDSAKMTVYLQKIEQYKAKLAKDSTDKDAVLKLGTYYNNIESYDSAEAVYESYLNKFPDDADVFYQYAQTETNNREFDKASVNMDTLLQKYPKNLKYQLSRAQLAVWTGRDYDRARTYLDNVLANDPNNLAALLAMSSLEMHTNHFVASQNYMNKIKLIDPQNSDLKDLESDIYIQKLRYKQEQQFAILLQGESLYGKGQCKEAIAKYDEYMAETPPNVEIESQYADVNVCAGNYQKAIDIYTNLLNQRYDYNIDLQRAKTYYYMGDSVDALSSLQRLVKNKPHDFTANLYLGDSYIRMHEYGKARDVYYNMEDSLKLDSTQTALVKQRLSWAPVTGFRGLLDSFPTYLLLTPYGSYYADNNNIKEVTQGIRLDVGLTSFLSVGVEAFRFTLASGSTSTFNYDVVNSNSLRWNIGLRLADALTFGVGFGNTYYGNNFSQPLANVYLRSDVANVYSAYATYDKLDASQVIYSTSFFNQRYNADVFRLGGTYQFKSGVKLGGDYTHFSFSDGNQGDNLALRVGKYFYPGFLLGYEYLSTSFAKTSPLYYSPSFISSHNLTVDWDIIHDTTATVTIGGLVGFIQNSNTIIRQAYAAATVRLASSFSIQARIAGGGSYQYAAGYSFFSAYVTAFWTL